MRSSHGDDCAVVSWGESRRVEGELLGIEMMGRGRREEVLCRHSAATWTREPCDHRHLPNSAKGRLCGERLLTPTRLLPPPRHVLLTFLYPARTHRPPCSPPRRPQRYL